MCSVAMGERVHTTCNTDRYGVTDVVLRHMSIVTMNCIAVEIIKEVKRGSYIW